MSESEREKHISPHHEQEENEAAPDPDATAPPDEHAPAPTEQTGFADRSRENLIQKAASAVRSFLGRP